MNQPSADKSPSEPQKQKTPTKKQQQKRSSALRDNLKRRKLATAPKSKPKPDDSNDGIDS